MAVVSTAVLPGPLAAAIGGWLDSAPAQQSFWETGPLAVLSGILASWLPVSTVVRIDGSDGPFQPQARPGPGGGVVVPMDVSLRVRHSSHPAQECPGHQQHLQASHWRETAGGWRVVDTMVDGVWQSAAWCLATSPPQTVGRVQAWRVALGCPPGKGPQAYVRVHNGDNQTLDVALETRHVATARRRVDKERTKFVRVATIPSGGAVDLGFRVVSSLRGSAEFFVGLKDAPPHLLARVSVPIRGRASHLGRRGWCSCSLTAATPAVATPATDTTEAPRR